MVHIRLDDNRIELSMGEPRKGPMPATLEFATKGAFREPVHHLPAPLAHIGQGEHTIVVAADGSYSGSHAGFQRRESGWFVADMDSTNGTYLASEHVPGDRALHSDPAVRFREVKVIFRSEPEIVNADRATDLLVIQDC